MKYVMLTKRNAMEEFLEVASDRIEEPLWTVNEYKKHPTLYFIRQEVFRSDLAKALVE